MPVVRIPVKVRWNGPGTPGVNVWHARVADVTVFADTTAWSTGHILATIKKFYDDTAGLRPASVVHTIGEDVVDVETDELVTVDAVNTSIGSMNESYAPQSLQMCVNWRTTLAARRGRGRTFLGPLHSTVMDGDGSPTNVALSTLRTAASAVVDSSDNVNGWAIGVWGQNAIYVPEPKVLRDVVAAQVSDKFAILRSRRD